MSGLVLSCFVLSCLVISCLVLSCLVLSCHFLSCLVISCLVLSCLVLSYHVLSCPVKSAASFLSPLTLYPHLAFRLWCLFQKHPNQEEVCNCSNFVCEGIRLYTGICPIEGIRTNGTNQKARWWLPCCLWTIWSWKGPISNFPINFSQLF